jgi:ABC-type multidrug transport system permease subunit
MSSARSTRFAAFRMLVFTRILEFFRESEVIFWNFVFPIVLAVGLGMAFRNRPAEPSPVGIVDGPGAAGAAAALQKGALLKPIVESEDEAGRTLRLGRVDLVLAVRGDGSYEYRFDPSRPEAVVAKARVADALERAAGRKDLLSAEDRTVSETGGRYIDFLIPGMIGMNLMTGGMWGVGFNLVDMRIKKLLKRFLATPMRRADFMLSILTVRIISMVVEVTFLLLFGWLAFGLKVRGSPWNVFAIGLLGSLSFGGLGLLIASRARRIEGVMGLMNVVTMPMYICSGVFFSSERFPQAVQPLIRALPLTALNDALRGIILEGTPLSAQAARIGILVFWGAVGFVVGLKIFRWT